MKRYILVAIMAILTIACSPVEDNPQPVQVAPTYITFSQNEFHFPVEGGSAQLEITAPSRPTLSGIPYWIKVTDGVYVNYKITYTITVEANYTHSPKEDYINVQIGTRLGGFAVYQECIGDPIDSNADIDIKLTNKNSSRDANCVYQFLRYIYGQRILSGVQSTDTANNNIALNRVYEITGKHPALSCYDFIFLQYSPTPENWSWKIDYSNISAAKEHWDANGLVSYMWHWNVPTSEAAWEKGKNGEFNGYGFYSNDTAFDITRALTDGTWENEFLLGDIDKVAGYLKLLQAEGIPVIWRPLHEAAGNYNIYGTNGAWFWWGRGGAEPCKRLWKLLRDKLEGEYGLDNLIWVWTLDATQGAETQYSDWYPGNEYVDIIGVDIYADDTEAKQRQYNAAVALSGGHKMVTISECGNIPDPRKCLSAAQFWSWFLVWDLDSYSLNTDTYWKTLMASPAVIGREDMPFMK